MENFQADINAINRISAVPTILEVVCKTTGMGFAAIARVTEDRWIACSVRDEIKFGLGVGDELKIETTICNEICHSRSGVVIDHVSEDPIYANHHTPAMYGFQSYISVPIILADGTFFGTLCAIDPKPADLKNSKTTGMFKLFSDLIAFHLSTVNQLAHAETTIKAEKENTLVREQFIAVLGHDLRNPLSAVSLGAEIILQTPLNDRATKMAHMIQDSCYRMSGLIENVLDLARGRIGSGIILNRKPHDNLETILNQVVTELRVIEPNRDIQTDFKITGPVNCDGKRIAQLLSNLLSNALTHGDRTAPIQVGANDNDGFELWVTNAGQKIPDAAMARLFHPFARGEVVPDQQGLGLGLFIATQIADAHNGKLSVVSTETETRFTLRLPSLPAIAA